MTKAITQKSPKRVSRFEPWENFYRVSLHLIHSRLLIVRVHGFCGWKKIIFFWPDGREFYRLKRNMAIRTRRGDANAPRDELFYGKRRRRYIGPRNCFIEFCNLAMKHRRPGNREFRAIGRELGLKNTVLNLYASFYRRHFLRKK